ncbi:MAG: TonB-dependent receptor [Gammaproteobacteria bacterium]
MRAMVSCEEGFKDCPSGLGDRHPRFSRFRSPSHDVICRFRKILTYVGLVLLIHTVIAGVGPVEAREVLRREVSFDIDASSLDRALMQFTQQSGLQLMMPTDGTAEFWAPRVVGSLTPAAALDQLLAGTSFEYEFTNSRTVAIRLAGGRVESSLVSDSSARSASAYRRFGVDGESASEEAVARSDEPTGPVGATDKAANSKRGIPEILVKGSRTMNVDVVRTEDDVQPYTILGSRQIEQSGAATTEDFLKRQLTMNAAVKTNAQAYGSSNGTVSSINLRGLSAGETLILVDGRRSASVNISQFLNSSGTQPDINGIPLSAIERIEVLPSSASAIYGGAALGGVVNIVLKRRFDSGDFSLSYDNTFNGSAPVRTVNGSYGFGLDQAGTQVFVGGQFSEAGQLSLGDREKLLNDGKSAILTNGPSYLYAAGAPFSGAVTNISSSPAFDFSRFPACSLGPAGFSGCITTPNLVLRDGRSIGSPITSVSRGAGNNVADGLLVNSGKYNLDLSLGTGAYGLHNPFGTAPRTKSIFTTLRQPLFKDIQLFAEFSINVNEGTATYNPIPDSLYQVPASSPINPFRQSVTITIPSIEEATQSTRSATKSATAGILVPLVFGWTSELDYTWSKNSFRFTSVGTDVTALNAALAVGTINPFVDTASAPLNLGVFLAPQSYAGDSTLNDVSLRASGEIGSAPGGAITLTVGLGHRKEGNGDARAVQDYPLTPENRIDAVYFGRSQSTESLYLEALLPLVSARNQVSAVRELDLQVAGRSERYTVYNGTAYEYFSPISSQASNPPKGVRETVRYSSTNPTVGLKYAPVRDIAFRASYATAFLPPTPTQLLANPTPICGAPCQTITDPSTGLSYLVDFTGGGNPNIRPQTSRSWSFGIIWEPRQMGLEGLRINLEHYRIVQPDYITSPTLQQVVGDSTLSSRVTRDPVSSLITKVDLSYLNASEYRTGGWDLKSSYRKVTPIGTLGFRLAGTVIDKDLRQFAVDSPFLEYAGFPNDGGEIKIKSNASLEWSQRGWTAAWTASYYSSYRQAYSAGSPLALRNPDFKAPVVAAQGGASIPSQTYHDIFLSYEFRSLEAAPALGEKMLSDLTLQVGVNNVFNSAPPFDAYNRPYFYSPLGDPRLRSYRLSLNKKF